ncbi:hypothetical protein ACHAXH_009116 [Discostella pseudostelligera]
MTMAANHDEYDGVAMLMSMGFDREQSIHALNVSAGNLENAIDSLLLSCGGGGFSGSGSGYGLRGNNNENSITTTTRAVHCNVSQYNNDTGLNGRSACTAIALTMACKLLTKMNDTRMRTVTKSTMTDTTATNIEDCISSDFLSASIQDGIRLHHRFLVHYSGVEHASVEELLHAHSGSENTSNVFSSLRQFGYSPRQGILSNASFDDNPMGMEATLSQCQLDAMDKQSYIAVVITKPPETVLVLLPPPAPSSSSHTYVLLDSHPRPQQLSPHYPTGSYALYHSSLRDLVTSLQQIFPVVELSCDVPEMMAMMYNSFDAYPFQCTMD